MKCRLCGATGEKTYIDDDGHPSKVRCPQCSGTGDEPVGNQRLHGEDPTQPLTVEWLTEFEDDLREAASGERQALAEKALPAFDEVERLRGAPIGADDEDEAPPEPLTVEWLREFEGELQRAAFEKMKRWNEVVEDPLVRKSLRALDEVARLRGELGNAR